MLAEKKKLWCFGKFYFDMPIGCRECSDQKACWNLTFKIIDVSGTLWEAVDALIVHPDKVVVTLKWPDKSTTTRYYNIVREGRKQHADT